MITLFIISSIAIVVVIALIAFGGLFFKTKQKQQKIYIAMFAIGFIFITSGIYWQFGAGKEIIDKAKTQATIKSKGIKAIVKNAISTLETKVAENPKDTSLLLILAQTYEISIRHTDAFNAYKKLATLLPNDTKVITKYAQYDLLSNGSLSEVSNNYLKQALKINPKNRLAVSILATNFQEQEQYLQAAINWSELLLLTANQKDREQILLSLEDALALLTKSEQTKWVAYNKSLVVINVRISVTGKAKANISDNDTIFIAVKTPNSPQPLAAKKISASLVPVEVSITKIDLLQRDAFVDQIIVKANISKSGQAGDADFTSNVVKLNLKNNKQPTINLIIDKSK